MDYKIFVYFILFIFIVNIINYLNINIKIKYYLFFIKKKPATWDIINKLCFFKIYLYKYI